MMDFFFFGMPSSKQVSSGSGVIFSANGYVVTNNHVVDQAESIEVVHQRKTYTAKVVGTDPSTDLALLKIDGQNFPSIKVADSRKISVGEWVLAVGNPFNLTSTVTAGIISAKGRNINILNSQFPIESFIQTDAAINPGNSGGALVNTKGELVGINTAIYSKTGSYSGYGFAVPSDIVKKVVEDLIKYGTVQKAFFGATVIEVDSKLADKLDLPDYKGVALTEVSDDGAAAKAGLKTDDVILKINGQTITGKGVFDEEISYYNPGDKATVQFRRGKTISTTTLTLTNREGTTELLKRSIFSSKTLGADLEPISKVERDRYKVEGGVRIIKVYGNGLMRRLGLTEGYTISAINQEACKEPRDVERLLSNARGRTILEGFDQNGRPSYYSFGF
jgi:Do/DeqQ family serine protease